MKKRILIAEDDDASRELLAEHLASWGYEVVQAQDGKEALAMICSSPPALALLDIQMPNMHGTDVVKTLRQDARLSHVPVIALTALAMRGDRERLLDLGFTEYLSKPLDPQILKRIMKRLLSPSEKEEEHHACHDSDAPRIN